MYLSVLVQAMRLMWEAEFPAAPSQQGRENPESQEGPWGGEAGMGTVAVLQVCRILLQLQQIPPPFLMWTLTTDTGPV